MTLIRNIALMGSSTVVRLGFGMLSFVILARALEAAGFGLFMYWFSVASLLALIPNFGFSLVLLREIGCDPDQTPKIMSEVLSAKLLLTVGVFLLSLTYIPFISKNERVIFMVLLATQTLDTFIEYIATGFRATGDFSQETTFATTAAIIQIIFIVAGISISNTPEIAAGSMLFAKVSTLALMWRKLTKVYGKIPSTSIAGGLRKIGSARYFAADFGLQSLFGQIDSLIIKAYLGTPSVGIFQAGMKIFLAGAQAAPIISNALIPKLAKIGKSSSNFRKSAGNLNASFLAVGFVGLIAFNISPAYTTALIYGNTYGELAKFFPLFGLLFFARFSAAGLGATLSAAGLQRSRTLGTIANLLAVFVPLLVFGIENLANWLCYLVLGNIILAICYAVIGIKNGLISRANLALCWAPIVLIIGAWVFR